MSIMPSHAVAATYAEYPPALRKRVRLACWLPRKFRVTVPGRKPG